VSDEVLPGHEIGRNFGRISLAVHNILLNPVSVRFAACFSYLEPFCLGRIKLVAGCGTAGSHVGHQRASVVRPATTLVSPFETNRTARIDVCNQRGGFGVLAAAQIRVRCSLYRKDGGDFADGGRTRGGSRGDSVVGFPIRSERGNITMSFNGRQQD